jgi:Skp family chaperone for outer membrane proteins
MHRSLALSLALLVLGLGLIVTGMVRADAQTPAVGAKIGVVNLQRTLLETSVGKNAQKKFEAEKHSKQKALDAKQQALQKAAAGLEKQRLVLTPEAMAKKQRELEKMYVDVQQTYAKLERELAESQAKLIQGILKTASPVIQQLAKEGGYTMIMDAGSVVWANSSADLTDKLNKKLK